MSITPCTQTACGVRRTTVAAAPCVTRQPVAAVAQQRWGGAALDHAHADRCCLSIGWSSPALAPVLSMARPGLPEGSATQHACQASSNGVVMGCIAAGRRLVRHPHRE